MRRTAALALTAALGGCEGDADCQENAGAQTLSDRVEVVVAGQSVLAELADEPLERERGWRKRACNRDAILLVPDRPEPLPVWGCELVDSIEVTGLREGAVVFVEPLDPCGPPCGGCPTVGDGVVVEAVLETLPGFLDVSAGDHADWP